MMAGKHASASWHLELYDCAACVANATDDFEAAQRYRPLQAMSHSQELHVRGNIKLAAGLQLTDYAALQHALICDASWELTRVP